MLTPLAFSRGLAMVYGVALPIAETIRRWGRIDYLPAFIDDWIIGAALLLGAWVTRGDQPAPRARRVLCGAWGFTCGLGYASFFGHLRVIDQPDVGPLPQVWLTAIIGVGWALAILALIAAVRAGKGD